VGAVNAREERGEWGVRRFPRKEGGWGKKKLMGGARQSARGRGSCGGSSSWAAAGLVAMLGPGRGPNAAGFLFFCSSSFIYFLFSFLCCLK
jgi:hypothetical protein